MAKKFSLLAGSHVVGATVYNKGDVVVSDDNLVAIFGTGKFASVGEFVHAEAPLPEPEPEADKKNEKSKKDVK
jgi:hypothetical protein